MQNILTYQSKDFTLNRYPKTEDKSLRAWSNAELLVLDYIKESKTEHIHLFNDRFGVWNCTLNNKKITTVWTYASQLKAVKENLAENNLSINLSLKSPIENLEQVDLALIKVPKSLALFELFLYQIQQAATINTKVVCGFMTKYFSKAMLNIAAKYFNVVEQTKAWKKARLLILKEPKPFVEKELINEIKFNNTIFKQYYGVFSSDKIDIGTQFFLEHLKAKETELNILDLASGNGVIAHMVQKQSPKANITLVDDFNLAIASSKYNVQEDFCNFICDNNLEKLPKDHFDLVVSNPPFHFEHENNIDISLGLFNQVKEVLHPMGRFILVANKHLNYQTHLRNIFSTVSLVEQNKKFDIIECSN